MFVSPFFALSALRGLAGTLRSLLLLGLAAWALQAGLLNGLLGQLGVPTWAVWALLVVSAVCLLWKLLMQLLPLVLIVALLWGHLPFGLPPLSLDGVRGLLPPLANPVANPLASPVASPVPTSEVP